MRKIVYEDLVENPMVLYIGATDGGGKISTSTVTLSVLSVVVEDFTPSCTENSLHSLIMEDMLVGSDVSSTIA